MKKISIIFGALLLLSANTSPSWNLEKEADGIKVYLAKTENISFKQFKAEAFVAAKPIEIAKAVTDLDNNYKWFENVQKAEVIKKINNNELLFKQVIEVPFPFKNRQVVQYCKTTKLADGTVRIDLNEQNDAAPLDDEYVRMPLSRGYWLLKPQNGGTFVEYSFLADPSGNIPAWLANQFIVESPFKTIAALRKYLAH